MTGAVQSFRRGYIARPRAGGSLVDHFDQRRAKGWYVAAPDGVNVTDALLRTVPDLQVPEKSVLHLSPNAAKLLCAWANAPKGSQDKETHHVHLRDLVKRPNAQGGR